MEADPPDAAGRDQGDCQRARRRLLDSAGDEETPSANRTATRQQERDGLAGESQRVDGEGAV